ncbi:hypothetical protein EDC96DRAFT_531310, partial [Choanephora cucurbitarum]
MGNSQSIDKAVHVAKEGINIYKQIKKQQEQEQQQSHSQHQEHHYQHQEHHYQQSHHSSYHPSADVDDDDEYARLRNLAHEEAQKRNE